MEEGQLLCFAEQRHLIDVVNLFWLDILEIHISQLSGNTQVLQVNLHNFCKYLCTSSFLSQLNQSNNSFFVQLGIKSLSFLIIFFFFSLSFHLRINVHFECLGKIELHQWIADLTNRSTKLLCNVLKAFLRDVVTNRKDELDCGNDFGEHVLGILVFLRQVRWVEIGIVSAFFKIKFFKFVSGHSNESDIGLLEHWISVIRQQSFHNARIFLVKNFRNQKMRKNSILNQIRENRKASCYYSLSNDCSPLPSFIEGLQHLLYQINILLGVLQCYIRLCCAWILPNDTKHLEHLVLIVWTHGQWELPFDQISGSIHVFNLTSLNWEFCIGVNGAYWLALQLLENPEFN